MNGIPSAVSRLLAARYPTLCINQEWLSKCVSKVKQNENIINDDQLAKAVRHQLLHTDLRKVVSSNPSTSLVSPGMKQGIIGQARAAVLVQITSIIDIGLSAAVQLEIIEARKAAKSTLGGESLLIPTVQMQTKKDEDAEEEEEEDHMAEFNAQQDLLEKSSTLFPRKMLMIQVHDGNNVMDAIEFERISWIDLNTTKLGCKLLIKNATVKKGKILLTPKSVTMEGGYVEEMERDAEFQFTNRLLAKLGKPPLEPSPQPVKLSSTTQQPSSTLVRQRYPTTQSMSHDTKRNNIDESHAFDDFQILDNDDDDSLFLAVAEMEENKAVRQPSRLTPPSLTSLISSIPSSKPIVPSTSSFIVGTEVKRSKMGLVIPTGMKPLSTTTTTTTLSNRQEDEFVSISDDSEDDALFNEIHDPTEPVPLVEPQSSNRSQSSKFSNTRNDPIVIESSPEP